MAREQRQAAAAKQREPSAVRDLTPKERQQLVVDALLQGASQSDALRAGGYHPTNGTVVMRHEQVQENLRIARGQITDITTLKRLDVLNIFLEAIHTARLMADPAQMINGADKVAKMMGFYAPEKLDINLTTGQRALQGRMDDMSDEELLAIASGEKTIDVDPETGEPV